MELIGKIKAKIHAHTFDGVPKDTEVTIFIPGVKHPLKALLSEIEIEGAAEAAIEELKPPKTTAELFKEMVSKGSLTVAGGWCAPSAVVYEMEGATQIQSWFPAGWTQSSVSGDETVATLKAAIPNLADITTPCPVCAGMSSPIYSMHTLKSWASPTLSLLDVIVHLNDYHKWSREDIANWLETKDWDLQFVTPEGETA